MEIIEKCLNNNWSSNHRQLEKQVHIKEVEC